MNKAARTREQIVHVAAALIRTMGPGQFSVAQIMARLKLTHGGFYAHFASKDELVQTALEEAFAEIKARAEEVVAGKRPDEALSSCIDWYVSAEMRDFPERACPLTVLTHDSSGLPPAAQSRLSEGAIRLTKFIERLLSDVGHPEPGLEAYSVTAEMVGAVSLARSVTDKDKSEQFLASTRASLKARLGLSGMDVAPARMSGDRHT